MAPAVLTRQFRVAQARSKQTGYTAPIAVVLWACVSPEVDRRLTDEIDQPLKLLALDWTSGEIIWIADAFGDPRAIEALLKQLIDTQWAGHSVKLRTRTQEGKASVGMVVRQTATPTH